MKAQPNLDKLSEEQVRALAAQLLVKVEQDAQTIRYQRALNDKLTHEMAVLKRHNFARRSEALSVDQRSLLDEHIDGDIGGIEEELARAGEQIAAPTRKKRQPKRTPLPPELPRRVIKHEPDNTTCSCGCALKRIGEDISEKLDYQPGSFTVEQHVRGKWVCDHCETLIQAPVPAQVIDKGVPASGLLAHVLVAKYADHLPLYRQEKIFDRAGLAIARSTLADWVGRCGVALQPLVDALRETLLEQTVLHADETPVPMLAPGKKKTHRAYVWAYASTHDAPVQCVIYDFAPTRAGEHARRFLQSWQGKLVCDDYAGYKEGFK
uniref:IS66 family transposase n=1 Tax=Vibrio sp. TaxID=678 RepID=UPI003D0D8D68